MNRKQHMLASVDNLMRVHEAWQADEKADVPTQKYEQAVEDCVGIVCNGDIPSDCRGVELSVSKLAMEWDLYRKGEKINSNGTPLDSLWAAYRGVVSARRGAVTPTRRTLESVNKLMTEKVPHLQIAKMYGIRGPKVDIMDAVWVGPFFDEEGRVRHDLIEQQAAFDRGEEGAVRVIEEGWEHPAETERVKRESAELDNRIQRLEAEDEARDITPHEDPATIEELLRQGQYPATVAKVKKCSLEEVMRISEQIGLEPNSKDNAETWDAQHPEKHNINQEILGATDAYERLSVDEVNQAIIELSESGEELSAGEMAKRVNETLGRNVISPQKVAAVLRERKKHEADVVT